MSQHKLTNCVLVTIIHATFIEVMESLNPIAPQNELTPRSKIRYYIPLMQWVQWLEQVAHHIWIRVPEVGIKARDK